jgi:hypothetical protein
MKIKKTNKIIAIRNKKDSLRLKNCRNILVKLRKPYKNNMTKQYLRNNLIKVVKMKIVLR